MPDQEINVKTGSFWKKTCPKTNFPPLMGGLEVDTVILGGGIAGITTATLLKDLGHTVALIESDRIVEEVTIGTTAKISVAPNMIYGHLIKTLGMKTAHKYAITNQKALEKIAEIVSEKKIDCEFQRTPLYIYTESSAKVEKINEEIKAAKTLGLPVHYANDVPLPFNTAGALMYENQAQFHPRKYLLGLAENLDGGGCYIFEKTRAITVKTGNKKEVITDHGSIMADNVVITTHTPFYDPDQLKNHLHPARSYVIGLYINGQFPDGMFIDFDPVHTYRTTPTSRGQLIIVAGEHSDIDVKDMNEYYTRLEKYAHHHLDVKSIEYRWSSHDSASDDGLPMIGMTSSEGIYVATGFGFWGMNNGTTSAMIISDMIEGKKTHLKDIFDPLRFKTEL
ncbi:MAG: FAD-dependent oxidoreductase [Methanobacterium sp.]